MQEANIPKARELLKTKRDLRAVKLSLLKLPAGTTKVTTPFFSPTGDFKDLELEVRSGALCELLDKELKYTDRMLTSLGVKELS